MSFNIASVLLSSKVNSWMTGINGNVEGKDVLRVLGYNGSAVKYWERAEEVAANGYREFAFGGRIEQGGDRA